ncbi:hypothetical protein GCM10009037_18360 [Halarchaeum grantii]|uniref:Uncharacterized protein n=1 Tax=Halarchaeum grantii TaxID=1193105 RepID=A0A830F3C2_9EURY|nr:hypothetical protein [Halarchaeum grantii]GGL35092.1 hypothetical protein GCM10009037_18360 [Halarchaeum grantii]
MNGTVRTVVCVVVGLFAGAALGPLFAPDPTGLLAAGLAGAVALLVGGGLYATWRRAAADEDGSGGPGS